MTKDWDAVQDEIKELSFNQKKPLKEVKRLMEQKYKFRASTRAYRMKLKEWGLTRHKGRKARPERDRGNSSARDDGPTRTPSVPAEPMAIDSESLGYLTKTGGWQVVSDGELPNAEPTFTGTLNQTPNLQSPIAAPVWMQDPPVASNSLQDMLQCVLDNDCEKLENILLEHVNQVNDPIGMPFEVPSSQFANHPALTQMVIMQHPRQTLLDIACGMPNGPVVWVLLTYGAKGSTHPLGTDLALHNAIKNGRHYTVQALLIPGRSEVNGLPGKRWRPLLQAVFWTGPEIVSILLKRGARVDDVGPSPTSSGMHTALQLCLERRAREYDDEAVRSKCNENLKLLLYAGASIHVSPPEGSTASPFEMFIEPWCNYDHWNMRLSRAEMDCLGKFVERGADLAAKFLGSPCAAGSSNTFIHQVLWHSPPCLSRQVVQNFSATAPLSGKTMLHEIVSPCADAKRHCGEALNDIELLFKQGVDPNALDSLGVTPLRKCIEQVSGTDVLAMTQKLLDGGADPEYEDIDGVQPYIVAALTLHDPLRFEVLRNMLAKMKGHHTKTKEGRTYRWEPGLFPIPDEPTSQQVLACTKDDGDFRRSMHEMVPIDLQTAVQCAYVAVITGRLLDNISKAAVVNKISEKDRWDMILTLSLRKGVNLPNYQFDQELVINLLDIPKMGTIEMSAAMTPRIRAESPDDNSTLQARLPEDVEVDTIPAYQPFQLNTSSQSTLVRPSSTPQQAYNSPSSNDALVGDTTQLRWLDPESSKASAPVASYVLQYKCAVCADGRLLTKTESQKHVDEHAHTEQCDGVSCTRRFCKRARNNKGV
ncbi:ankyrin [Didymella exigua CBS 183.55]|uniref:Ankyrin n=1 Tax=Didymella exigua CBS 183.55 TaxID=1150837 RepID=A0A6A5RG87_9PLEO|nr:ankyrin [Didymella exigua CBS 183.55]KAF1927315.1 ankyrin [Didymella exigua CBS 183.55]